MGTLKRKS